jgi:hypothetical protein
MTFDLIITEDIMADPDAIIRTIENLLSNVRELIGHLADTFPDDERRKGMVRLIEEDFPRIISALEKSPGGIPEPVSHVGQAFQPANNDNNNDRLESLSYIKPVPQTPSTVGRVPFVQVFSKPEMAALLSKPLEGRADELRKRIIDSRGAVIAGPNELDSDQASRLAEVMNTLQTALAEGLGDFEAAAGAFNGMASAERINFFPGPGEAYTMYPKTDVELKKEFAAGVPRGEIIRIERLGVIKGAECLQKAAVVISRGEETEEMRLLSSLKGLEDYINSHGLAIDPKLTAFIQKAPDLMDALLEGDRKGDKGLKILIDALGFVEKLGAGAHDEGLEGACGRIAMQFANHLSARGIVFFPEGDASAADDPARFETRKGYSDLPEGSVIRVAQRGIEYKDRIIRKALVFVSGGPPPEVYGLLEEAQNALMKLRSSGGAPAKAAAKGLRSIAEWMSMVPSKSPETRPDFARYALALKKNGYSEVRVVIGDMFDESYSPSKYERKKLPSHEPRGKILRLIRRGFLDKNGIPVQKAVVGISEG